MAINLFSRLMPAQESFTQRFCDQTKHIVAAAQELQRMIDGEGKIDSGVAAIRAIESAADGVARTIFVAANRTFNAPIDREDILELAHNLDDAVDLIEDTAKGIQRYALRQFPTPMRTIAGAVVRSASLLHDVMPLLDAITREHKKIFELCEQVGHIEGEADEAFDMGLYELREQLRSGALDTIGYIDRKEIYELVEQVVDKCDDVSNALQAITAKHV